MSPAVTTPTAQPASQRSSRIARNVILVTIDGVRWQDVFLGVERARAGATALQRSDAQKSAAELLPHLHALMAKGIALGAPTPNGGAPMVASGPNFVSLPGYRELLTGRASRVCTDNGCGHIEERTIFDELRAHGSNEPLAVIASWEKLERVAALDDRALVVSTGRHGGRTRGQVDVSARMNRLLAISSRSAAFPGWGDYRPDRFTSAIALEYLRAQRPRVLHVALGDTDEYAHRGDYASYVAALRAADFFIGELNDTLLSLGEYGDETMILVTTDHGRSHDFTDHGGGSAESARVWLVAAGASIPCLGPIAASRTLHLADVVPTIRALLSLAPDDASNAGQPIAEMLPAGSEGFALLRHVE